MRRDRGFALLLVLWSLVLLTLITTRLIAGGRDEARLAANLRAAAQAEMVADAAIHETIFRLLARTEGWAATRSADNPQPRRIARPGGTAEIAIEDESGRVNPNQASDALLQALLRAVGADAGTARTTAAAIVDWRTAGNQARDSAAQLDAYRAAGHAFGPPHSPFRSIDELGLVLGITPALLARLAPHFTIFYDGDPDPDAADPLVLAALRQAAGQADIGGAGQSGTRTVRLAATATSQSGARFTRIAVVRLAPDGAGRPYRLLDWRRGNG